MRILQKIIAGGPGRKSRLHTEKNELIPVAELRHLPTVAGQYITTKLRHSRPAVPWWPMSVIPVIEELLRSKSCRVVEFGSGSSTIWLAKRSVHVTSIEDDPQWVEVTRRRIAALGIGNTEVRFAQGSDYYDLGWAKEERFDLAIVDGSWRWKCIESVLPLMRAAGVVYLDNSDSDKDKHLYQDRAMSREAQRVIAAFEAATPGVRVQRYSSLISGELHAGEGMLVYMPG